MFVYYALAFATEQDPLHQYAVLVNTPPAQTFHPREGLAALVALWMDDFDANMSLSKLNHQGVFATVATIMFVNSDGILVGAYSNLLAAGKKEECHEGILYEIQQGLGVCPGQHYCEVLHQCVPLRVHLLHCVCDQPAKRDLCGLKRGNGKYHACFGYSINFGALTKPFPPCDNCRSILLDTTEDPPPCAHCHA